MLRTCPIWCGRTAQPATDAYNLAKTFMQIILFWGVFLWVVPSIIGRVEQATFIIDYRFTSPLSKSVGIVLFALMSCLGLTCAATMVLKGRGTPLPADCTRELVVTGPYRFVRNPMAIAGLSQGLAVGIFLGSPSVVLYALVGMVGWNYFVRPWEEKDLYLRFGESYLHYRNSVRCWIPHLRGYTGQ